MGCALSESDGGHREEAEMDWSENPAGVEQPAASAQDDAYLHLKPPTQRRFWGTYLYISVNTVNESYMYKLEARWSLV